MPRRIGPVSLHVDAIETHYGSSQVLFGVSLEIRKGEVVTYRVPALKRDVFLDSDPAPDAVAREFERLKALARERGLAVGIGHPYPATLDFLEREIPRLVEEGIELVPVRELIDFY